MSIEPAWTFTTTLPEHLHGDGPCTDCDTVDNIIWFTDSVFWNEVVRQGDYIEPILCVPCFVKRVDAAGLAPTGWRLVPDFHWETKAERAARKAGPS
jgi:hypothetical protein